MKIKWRHRQHCKWSRQQHVLLYVIKWQMISFQALWKTKSFVKVCLKFKLPLWTKGLLIHLSPLWHFPRWHNFPRCLSHKRRLASNADVGFYCINIMTTSFSSPERIEWTIMSGIITVTRLMSSLGIKDHWVKWIHLWFIHTLYAKRTRWNYMYIYFIAKKTQIFKSWPWHLF